ncbi:hypothetical protein F2Q69_00001778 [Brassica cretica]|uniref:Uncharacterized protein n=1 Tax=Brassica cretica TaxID=69181 RepID=A0A8S9P8W9_BRACR|nr:hypothetical protein F2Q69_00001778 [Brassica cretica]
MHSPPYKTYLCTHSHAIATTTLFTVCSRGFCRLLRRKTDRNRHGRPQFRSSRGLSRLLHQKTDPNPPWTTIFSVLTASPPDWRFSQVSGDRCGGEEVHEGKPHPSSILIPCISDYGPKLLLLCFREEFGDRKITVFQLSPEAPAPVGEATTTSDWR